MYPVFKPNLVANLADCTLSSIYRGKYMNETYFYNLKTKTDIYKIVTPIIGLKFYGLIEKIE